MTRAGHDQRRGRATRGRSRQSAEPTSRRRSVNALAPRDSSGGRRERSSAPAANARRAGHSSSAPVAKRDGYAADAARRRGRTLRRLRAARRRRAVRASGRGGVVLPARVRGRGRGARPPSRANVDTGSRRRRGSGVHLDAPREAVRECIWTRCGRPFGRAAGVREMHPDALRDRADRRSRRRASPSPAASRARPSSPRPRRRAETTNSGTGHTATAVADNPPRDDEFFIARILDDPNRSREKTHQKTPWTERGARAAHPASRGGLRASRPRRHRLIFGDPEADSFKAGLSRSSDAGAPLVVPTEGYPYGQRVRVPRRGVAAPPRAGRGSSVGQTRRRRGRDVDRQSG